MKNSRISFALFVVLAILSGCSSERYLRPETSAGSYRAETPQCPGPKKFVEYRMPAEWIVFLVGADLPNRRIPEGTRLVAYFEMQFWRPKPPRTRWSIFPSDEEKAERENLFEERKNQKVEITWSSPFVTVVLPDGTKTKVLLPLFEKPYKPNEMKRPDNYWEGVLISPKRLESFTIIFPDMLFNGQKLDIPPVKFKVDTSVDPVVLNC
jgi:hypothetical protein